MPKNFRRCLIGGLLLLAIGCGKNTPQPSAGDPAGKPIPVVPGKEPGDPAPSATTLHPDEPILSPKETAVPGILPTGRLRYRADATVNNVAVAGSWDRWKVEHPLAQRGGVWEIDVSALKPAPGRHEFKFIIDDEYESGQNRLAFVNGDHLLERPPGILAGLWIDTPRSIRIDLARSVPSDAKISVTLDPAQPVRSPRLVSPRRSDRLEGFSWKGDRVRFVFDPAYYGEQVPADASISVAGPFNDWKPGRLMLTAQASGLWEVEVPFAEIKPVQENEPVLFKFVIDGERWLAPPVSAPNRTSHGGAGHTNLSIQWQAPSGQYIVVDTEEDLPLNRSVLVRIEGLYERPLVRHASPRGILTSLDSEAPMGGRLTDEGAVFRIFAPRARTVDVLLYDNPEFSTNRAPQQVHALVPEKDGAWVVELPGVGAGQAYAFQIDGPRGNAEGFDPETPVSDPWALAVAHAENHSLLIDPEAETPWFKGWTDAAFQAPAHEDLLIYETHVRDLTADASSPVPAELKGTYAGVLASEGTGTGLDHIKAMGYNAIELMPVQEFTNGTNRYDWGYGPSFYFAPEASYARAPLEGSQYYEFKHLVNELHARGFAVIVDVVYNHLGAVNVLSLADKKYYFRHGPDLRLENYSGCGNDTQSESPMMRRLIIESVLYWMTEFHIDGFRFDLAELIDMETLMEVRKAAVAVNPDVILISEPWSFRGSHKKQLKGTGWAAWNDVFRDSAKHFISGKGDVERLKVSIAGSTATWTASPLQTINYLESHDDYALVDELSARADRDGRNLTPRDEEMARMGATLLMTSLGIPMITEGQEFLRSKHGVRNTYNKGDALNALRWDDRDRPPARRVMQYYQQLGRLRASKAGESFRIAEAPPPGYVRFVEGLGDQQIGYVINGDRRHPGAGFAVLVNAGDEAAEIGVDLPAGSWVQVGFGERVALEREARRWDGGQQHTLTVPPRMAYMLMRSPGGEASR